MNSNGKISVIVPVYNTSEFLDNSIGSLIDQTYHNLEIIIIDDGSDQQCKNKLLELSLKDERIKLYTNEYKKGVGFSRNKGIEEANGEFIFFMDSDDYIDRRTIELLVNNIKDGDFIKGKVKNTTFSKALTIIFDGLFTPKVYDEDKYKLIKNKSCLNCLIRTNLIKENGILFSEDVEAYSDMTFIIPLLKQINSALYLKEAVYFRRKRNDPINNPSISQYSPEELIQDYLLVHKLLRNKFENDQLIIDFLNQDLLNYYRKKVIAYFKDKDNIDVFYSKLVDVFQKIDQKTVKKQDLILKREIKYLKRGNINEYKNINQQHRFLRDLKKGLQSRRKFYIFIYEKLFLKLSLREDIVFFESFLGKSYSDNPKHIYEYMINNDLNYKYVWSFRETKDIPGNTVQVKRFSLRYFYYLARAKYWVSNARLPKYLIKREGNIYLQTWHGTPLKTLVFDVKEIHSADPKHKESFYHQSRRWDYLISPNQYSSDIFRRAFKFNNQMLEYGYPRNDILYTKNNETDISNIKKKIDLPEGKKVILYAPTWRDDEFFSRGKYKFSLHLDLQKMKEQFQDTHILVLRTHYHISNQIDVSEFEGFVYDRSKYDDIAELYLVSDLLITDYSSVFFDYAHLKRPILFYTYDLEKYRDDLRGFYFDMEKEVPGPLLRTTSEVIDSIANLNVIEEQFRHKYEIFYDKYCKWDDGKASENTVKTVFNSKK